MCCSPLSAGRTSCARLGEARSHRDRRGYQPGDAATGGEFRLVGDVAFAEVAEVAGAITPVPGGVGPMTIACLLENTLWAACLQGRGGGAGEGRGIRQLPADDDCEGIAIRSFPRRRGSSPLRKMPGACGIRAGEPLPRTCARLFSSFLRADWVPAFAGTSGDWGAASGFHTRDQLLQANATLSSTRVPKRSDERATALPPSER